MPGYVMHRYLVSSLLTISKRRRREKFKCFHLKSSGCALKPCFSTLQLPGYRSIFFPSRTQPSYSLPSLLRLSLPEPLNPLLQACRPPFSAEPCPVECQSFMLRMEMLLAFVYVLFAIYLLWIGCLANLPLNVTLSVRERREWKETGSQKPMESDDGQTGVDST